MRRYFPETLKTLWIPNNILYVNDLKPKKKKSLFISINQFTLLKLA